MSASAAASERRQVHEMLLPLRVAALDPALRFPEGLRDGRPNDEQGAANAGPAARADDRAGRRAGRRRRGGPGLCPVRVARRAGARVGRRRAGGAGRSADPEPGTGLAAVPAFRRLRRLRAAALGGRALPRLEGRADPSRPGARADRDRDPAAVRGPAGLAATPGAACAAWQGRRRRDRLQGAPLVEADADRGLPGGRSAAGRGVPRAAIAGRAALRASEVRAEPARDADRDRPRHRHHRRRAARRRALG